MIHVTHLVQPMNVALNIPPVLCIPEQSGQSVRDFLSGEIWEIIQMSSSN